MLVELIKRNKALPNVLVLSVMLVTAACGPSRPPVRSDGHLAQGVGALPTRTDIPDTVQRAPVLPRPTIKPKLETYTVVVTEAPAKELLFALARDAKLNLDIYDNIEGVITINAIDQTLPQILDRIAKQSNIRYEIRGKNLTISADTPYLHTYNVEYVNLSRKSTAQIQLSTQISATGSGSVGDGAGSNTGASGGNNSNFTVNNTSNNQFWETLFLSISSIVSDKKATASQSLVSDNVIVNREVGLITVRATSKQHKEIQVYIDSVVTNAQRQVLIEATVVEVKLSNNYQSGVDWSRLASGAVDPFTGFAEGSNGASILQRVTGASLSTPPTFTANYNSTNGDVTATVRMLEEFGDIKVLSSPKIMALNNQPAILKVVDNRVYFTIDVNVTNSINSEPIISSETEIHTVPVGFIMGVTPYIGDNEQVILNVRPTISRILRFINAPQITNENIAVENLIPEIQVREMESILRLNNGQMGVIGGLMQDEVNKDTDAVPLLARIPFLGNIFKRREDQVQKSELVIFIRAVVIKNPSLDADLQHLKTFLPSSGT